MRTVVDRPVAEHGHPVLQALRRGPIYDRSTDTGGGDIPVDQARLRANAREVRTLLTELDDAVRAYVERLSDERRGLRDAYAPTEVERASMESARGHLLGCLAKHFLALTEELAGDIDQDVTTWKPPPE